MKQWRKLQLAKLEEQQDVDLEMLQSFNSGLPYQGGSPHYLTSLGINLLFSIFLEIENREKIFHFNWHIIQWLQL